MPFTTLVDTVTLAAHLHDPAFLVVDCRYSLQSETWGSEEYIKQHIPGAVFASIDHDLAGPKTGANGRHPLPEVADVRRTFGRLGITNGVQVVAYDQGAGMYASRLWWLLRWLGHDAAVVLDGGFAKWLDEKRPTASGEHTRAPREFTGAPRPGLSVNAEEVAAVFRKPDWRLVDARAPSMVPLHEFSLVPNLVYCASKRDVTSVVIDGRIVMRDRAFPRLDEARIRDEAQAHGTRLMARLKLPVASRWPWE